MHPQLKSLLANIGAVGIIVGAFLVLIHPQWVGFESAVNNKGETIKSPGRVAAAPAAQSASTSPAVSTTTPRKNTGKSVVKSAPITPLVPPATPVTATTTDGFIIARTENPYPFPPLSFASINDKARLALVNILCAPRNGSLSPISASGVIIDPRGVILTNAHVAQYLLLAADPAVNLSCVVRAGSPAYPTWNAETLFVPPTWVKEHAVDITTAHAAGTGEYDYALLRITSAVAGQAMSAAFPFLPIDTREAIAFTEDPVLVASYPAEFLGGIVTQMNLYPASSITTIQKLLTFDNKTVDIMSLGGIIEAQSGSSGGAAINEWGRLVGIISTTSGGTTTAARDLHAITLSYINRNIVSESGRDLSSILEGNLAEEAYSFNTSEAPALRQLLIDQITRATR